MTTTTTTGPAQAGPIAALKRLIGGLDRISYGVIVVVMAAMAILVAAQVFFRYALSDSIDSADELSRLFFIWAMFMAIPHGIKIGIHVGIDLMVRALPPGVQEFLFRAMSGASAVLMIVVFYFTVFVTADKWQDMMPTIDVTAAVYYIPVLLSAGHSFLHLVALLIGGSKVWAEDAS